MQPTPAALEEAVNALYRVRAVERMDPDGLRTVWHQCAHGADLLSRVDRDGHVVQQELTLLGDFFRWDSRAGLVTGEVEDAPRGQFAAAGSTGLALDRGVSRKRIARAQQALASYGGEDRYIRSIRRIIGMVSQGLADFEEITVTRSAKEPALELPTQARRQTLLVGGLALLVLAGALAAWIL